MHRREFLRRLGVWLAASAVFLLTGKPAGPGGAAGSAGHPARFYRKLAG
jgi:hypothetical protein